MFSDDGHSSFDLGGGERVERMWGGEGGGYGGVDGCGGVGWNGGIGRVGGGEVGGDFR